MEVLLKETDFYHVRIGVFFAVRTIFFNAKSQYNCICIMYIYIILHNVHCIYNSDTAQLIREYFNESI